MLEVFGDEKTHGWTALIADENADEYRRQQRQRPELCELALTFGRVAVIVDQ